MGSNPVAVTYTTLYSYRDQASYLSQQLVLASKFQCDLRDTVDCCRKWLVHFNAGKSQLCLTGLITQVLLMWKWMGLFLRKNILLRWWDCLSLLNWAGPLRLSPFLKLPPRILSLYFDLWSFFLPKLLFISINLLCKLYKLLSCLDCASSYQLDMLEKFQKRVCWPVGSTLGASFEPLGHCRNGASLSLFYRYSFGRSSYELDELVLLRYSRGRFVRCSHRLRNLSPFLVRPFVC